MSNLLRQTVAAGDRKTERGSLQNEQVEQGEPFDVDCGNPTGQYHTYDGVAQHGYANDGKPCGVAPISLSYVCDAIHLLCNNRGPRRFEACQFLFPVVSEFNLCRCIQYRAKVLTCHNQRAENGLSRSTKLLARDFYEDKIAFKCRCTSSMSRTLVSNQQGCNKYHE